MEEKVYPVADGTRTDSPGSDMLSDLPHWKYSFWGTFFGMSEEERKYRDFMSNENSIYTHMCMTIIGSVVHLLLFLEVYVGDYPSDFRMFIIQRICLLPSLWLHLYAVIQKKYPHYFRSPPINISFFGDVLMLSYSFSFGLYLYGMTTVGGCDPTPLSPRLMSTFLSTGYSFMSLYL